MASRSTEGEPHPVVAYYLLTCLAMRGERSQ